MAKEQDTAPVRIGPGGKTHSPLGFGGFYFDATQWAGDNAEIVLAAMKRALEKGLNHFDTATEYGHGQSERLIGQFLAAEPGRRERIFLASKYQANDISFEDMLAAVDASCARMQTDSIDLYYIHWPRAGKDLRPWMEALETARQQGKISTIGVSNFSVEQMQQVSEVGRIDAHQLPYNLLWRFADRDVIPYCEANKIAVVTYSSLAHGALGGRFQRNQAFPAGDQRRNIVLFRPDVWPQVYDAIESFKRIGERIRRPVLHLALRWLLHQSGITSVLVSARNPEMVDSNAQVLEGDIADDVFEELTAISDRLMQQIPDTGNPYDHHP